MNFTQYIGSVERNTSGHIISAKAALHQWFMKVNRTAIAFNVMNGAMDGLGKEVGMK